MNHARSCPYSSKSGPLGMMRVLQRLQKVSVLLLSETKALGHGSVEVLTGAVSTLCWFQFHIVAVGFDFCTILLLFPLSPKLKPLIVLDLSQPRASRISPRQWESPAPCAEHLPSCKALKQAELNPSGFAEDFEKLFSEGRKGRGFCQIKRKGALTLGHGLPLRAGRMMICLQRKYRPPLIQALRSPSRLLALHLG